MTWNIFIYFAIVAVLLWAAGAWLAVRNRYAAACGLTAVGVAVFLTYIVLLWYELERPPLRTMGETRLWYSLLLSLMGGIVYMRQRLRWILPFSALLSAVFVGINLFRPEIHSKTLMPALQSVWFVPHVIVYMFAYALLGAAALMSVGLLLRENKVGLPASAAAEAPSPTSEAADGPKPTPTTLPANAQDYDESVAHLVAVGLAFLTIGMLFGALWAKEAWGHYWSWDPKETWAAITWLAYLVYLHDRLRPNHDRRWSLALVFMAFLLLQMCWWGINFLPSAQGASVHTYS